MSKPTSRQQTGYYLQLCTIIVDRSMLFKQNQLKLVVHIGLQCIERTNYFFQGSLTKIEQKIYRLKGDLLSATQFSMMGWNIWLFNLA